MAKQLAPPLYPLGGFNAAQLERIFEEIACSADVASTLAAYAAQQSDIDDRASNDFLALQRLTQRIGALAEMVVPGTVHVAPSHWALGPYFSELKELTPEEVAHG